MVRNRISIADKPRSGPLSPAAGGARRAVPALITAALAVLAQAVPTLSVLALAACSGADRPVGMAETDDRLLPGLFLGPSLLSSQGATSGRTAPVINAFEAIDSDGDGHLSEAEIAHHLATRFARADRNGDGELDLAELGLAGQPVAAQTLPFDLDGNGRMSLAEQRIYINTVISETSGTGSATVLWRDVDRRLVR
ncbi:hypothetical protein ACFOGJ_21165 [Marinibaculum pumilum]|uniref:EF-hand domain-containing protein n=1 Tax=Marinibaculum pumilum TaxID=1766165 RepID=A0ABV7L568_9PROT